MSPDSELWVSGAAPNTVSNGVIEYIIGDETALASAYQITATSSGTAMKAEVALVNVTGGSIWVSINGSSSTELVSSSWILLAAGSSFQAYSSNPGI
jgi:hypothetical protein